MCACACGEQYNALNGTLESTCGENDIQYSTNENEREREMEQTAAGDKRYTASRRRDARTDGRMCVLYVRRDAADETKEVSDPQRYQAKQEESGAKRSGSKTGTWGMNGGRPKGGGIAGAVAGRHRRGHRVWFCFYACTKRWAAARRAGAQRGRGLGPAGRRIIGKRVSFLQPRPRATMRGTPRDRTPH